MKHITVSEVPFEMQRKTFDNSHPPTVFADKQAILKILHFTTVAGNRHPYFTGYTRYVALFGKGCDCNID
jgi:hypothetical protein